MKISISRMKNTLKLSLGLFGSLVSLNKLAAQTPPNLTPTMPPGSGLLPVPSAPISEGNPPVPPPIPTVFDNIPSPPDCDYTVRTPPPASAARG